MGVARREQRSPARAANRRCDERLLKGAARINYVARQHGHEVRAVQNDILVVRNDKDKVRPSSKDGYGEKQSADERERRATNREPHHTAHVVAQSNSVQPAPPVYRGAP